MLLFFFFSGFRVFFEIHILWFSKLSTAEKIGQTHQMSGQPFAELQTITEVSAKFL